METSWPGNRENGFPFKLTAVDPVASCSTNKLRFVSTMVTVPIRWNGDVISLFWLNAAWN
jgi:hypothetical protein